MEMSIWYHVILTRLDLVELIKMRRVCKAFYKYKKLKDLIKLKKEILFGKIKKKYWHKPDKTNLKIFSREFTEKHSEKFLYLHGSFDCKYKVTYFMAAFSSKNSLFEHFLRFYNPSIYKNEENEYYSFYSYKIEGNKIAFIAGPATIKYTNINKEILDHLQSFLI